MGEAMGRFETRILGSEILCTINPIKEFEMRLRTLMLIGMVLAFLFALALLLGPAIILKFFGLTGSATEVVLGQLLGAGLIGIGVLCWFAKDSAEPQGTVLSLFVGNAVAFVVALLAVLAKVPKGGNAWIVVILFLLFAGGFAYFQFAGPRE